MTDIPESWCWSPALSVGVNAIDDDHKKLFQLFYEAHLISQEDNIDLLYKLANELILYTESHFSREEAIMSVSDYPHSQNHQSIHNKMIKQLQKTLQHINADQESVTEFIVFFKNWFINHIKGTDQEISQYTQGYEKEIEMALIEAGPLTISEKISIYVVDDEDQQVDLMLEMIDVAGFFATGYTSASIFIEQSISDNDIILLDLNMPHMDGIEVMRLLHDRGCHPTYFLISGFDDRVLHSAKQFADAKNITVTETFTKPIDTHLFIKCINRIHGEKKLVLDSLASTDEQQTAPFKKENQVLSRTDLITALEQHQFVLFYQPQINLQTGELHGFEALVRLQHPDRGLIFPDQFIALAEQYNLISDLTNEVIHLATDDYLSFRNTGINPKISINISAQDLLDLSMPEYLSKQLKSKGIPAHSITIELTESAILTSVSDSLDILNRLRMKGFPLSIDDFGTGNSSLVQLYQAPFTELKIDQHFIMKMMNDNEAMSIVKICILLAKELKMDTVAEGVETQQILDKLKELNCDFAQGYHISKPMPLKTCCEWIAKNK
ncbi:MAG: bacteriohemerythrin [Piscirickettsiaceae bacterium]|nr:bacteriohemerythrin [Piscirickettsiaceae bacterium]